MIECIPYHTISCSTIPYDFTSQIISYLTTLPLLPTWRDEVKSPTGFELIQTDTFMEIAIIHYHGAIRRTLANHEVLVQG